MEKRFSTYKQAVKAYGDEISDGTFQCSGCQLHCFIDDHACNSSECEVHQDDEGNYCSVCCPDEVLPTIVKVYSLKTSPDFRLVFETTGQKEKRFCYIDSELTLEKEFDKAHSGLSEEWELLKEYIKIQP